MSRNLQNQPAPAELNEMAYNFVCAKLFSLQQREFRNKQLYYDFNTTIDEDMYAVHILAYDRRRAMLEYIRQLVDADMENHI